jgi:Bacterial SH3 domain
MKNFLFFCLSLLVFTNLSAQENPEAWMHSDGTLEGFTVGAKYFTLVTDANLREKPNTQSNVLTKLPIGTPVTVEVATTDSFTLRGVKLPWLKVQCQPKGAAAVSGYIWGGFMALASIQTPDEEYETNRNVLYLTGVAAYDEAKHGLTVQVRVALDGKELAKTEFTTSGDLSYYPSFDVIYDSFKDVNAIISVNYYYPACGYPSGNNLLFWQKNNQLTKVLETSSVSEAGLFYASEDYILPSQRGGIGDHILVVNDQSEFEEKGTDFVRKNQKYKLSLFKWTGTKLQKVKDFK